MQRTRIPLMLMTSVSGKSSLCLVILVIIWQIVTCSAAADSSDSGGNSVWMEFTHERCQKEILSSNQFKIFYNADNFFGDDGVLELLVRFKGIADGHIILTSNASVDEPRYAISLGSYNNRFSEIRRNSPVKVEAKESTPSIMSDLQFRGFLIRYDPQVGRLSVFGEGSDHPLLQLDDTNAPLNVSYFSFATWHNRVVQVAFNCLPKDTHSLADVKSRGNHVWLGFSDKVVLVNSAEQTMRILMLMRDDD